MCLVKSISYLTNIFKHKMINDSSVKHIFDSFSGPTVKPPTAEVVKETNSVAADDAAAQAKVPDDPFPDTLFPTTEPEIDKIVPQFTTPKHSVSGKKISMIIL